MKTFKVFINTNAASGLNSMRRLRLAPGEAEYPTAASRTAEKMIISCRENIRFLNQYLEQYEKYLALPPLIENVLYLACTIEIKENAPFMANQLRQHLTKHGIETSTEFHFAAQPFYESSDSPAIYAGEVYNRLNSGKFCIPCHMGLTILDLQQIVDAFNSFFRAIESGHRSDGAGEG